jgi:hypothetical protein
LALVLMMRVVLAGEKGGEKRGGNRLQDDATSICGA